MKAVIFDCDGMVLTGTRFSDAYAKEFDIPIEDMEPFFAGPFEECILGRADLKEALLNGGWLQKWRWSGTADALLGYWFNCGNTLNERVLATVADLRRRGVICILTTNQEKYRATYLRDTLGLAGHFDAVVISSEIGSKKPQPEFFKKAMDLVHAKDASVQRSDVQFWDDRIAHVAGAKTFGFDSHLFVSIDGYQKILNSGVR